MRGWIGRVVVTWKPPSGRGPAYRFPPTERARSRKPVKPRPPPGTTGLAAVPSLVTVKQEPDAFDFLEAVQDTGARFVLR